MKTHESIIDQGTVLSSSQLLDHWMGHRSLTRKVIEIFPEEKLFSFSIGGMRPFADMVKELLAIAEPGIQEIATGQKTQLNENLSVNTKEQILKLWDLSSESLPVWWQKLEQDRFQEKIMAFGQYEGTVISTLLYFIDNEIHHRKEQ